MSSLYDEINEEEISKIDIRRRTDLKKIYYSFLADFRDYLQDFVRRSYSELVITEVVVGVEPVRLVEHDISGRYFILKNQGDTACYLTTGKGGYRLDPGEKLDKIWVNRQVTAVTISGTTILGVIKS